jgi:ubiquinone/menaquinone biosynthesis C-methylase UbiE
MTPALQRQLEERIVQQFSLQAVPWAANPGEPADESIDRLLNCTGVGPTDTVLDVACGTGQVALEFATTARQVTGIDLTPAMIEKAKARQARMHRENVRWAVGNACDLPFSDASFSIVTCRYALHHMLDPARAVSEMTRVCAPGGRVCLVDVITTPDCAEAYDGFERLRDPSHIRALTLDELNKLVETAPLERLAHSFYDFEIELEVLLNGSFPDGVRKQELRELIARNLDWNSMGIRTDRRGAEIVVAYPIAIVAASRV